MKENKSEPEKTWGGARKGAGRKRSVNAGSNINFRIDADLEEELRKQGNISRFVNEAIREKLGKG